VDTKYRRSFRRDGCRLIREAQAGTVVPPDDVDALREAIQAIPAQWRLTGLPDLELPVELERRVSRRERVCELAEFLHQLELPRADREAV
jgi:hypothetical protein